MSKWKKLDQSDIKEELKALRELYRPNPNKSISLDKYINDDLKNHVKNDFKQESKDGFRKTDRSKPK